MSDTDSFDDDLPPWSEPPGAERQCLLIGNGFSCHVWPGFRYASLFQVARDSVKPQGLMPDDVALFDAFHTENFEHVLSMLATASAVAAALGQPRQPYDTRYKSVQAALVAAVHHVHVPWDAVTPTRLTMIAERLRRYSRIYSTNYDLLIYWAAMQNPNGFRDYFWNPIFDVGNTDVWEPSATCLVYLHGGLHLRRGASGNTRKEAAGAFTNLLQAFSTIPTGETPLFVSEGTPADKLATIRRSDYLSFAQRQFSSDSDPLVIFGQSLSDPDQHLIDALARRRDRQIRVGMRASTGNVRQRKLAIAARLPKARLTFFDAGSHPLADAGLAVSGGP